MKKQILILTFFVAAILVGTNAFGQKTYQNYLNADGTCIVPNALTGCTADELHPVQGQTYTYTVTASAQTDVRWFVVNNNTVVANSDSIIGYGGVLPSTYADIEPSDGTGSYIYGDGSTVIPEYNIDPVANSTGQYHSIDIAWKYFDGVTDQVLLVAYAEDSVGCTDNIVVYRIIPEPAFTIDVAVLDDDGDSIAGVGTTVAYECVSPIEFAIYDASSGVVDPGVTPGDSLIVDYGENWVYFVVNGANYFDSWWPEFQISYDGGYNTIEAAWAYAADADDPSASVWHTLTDDGSNLWTGADMATDAVIAGGPTNSVGDGEVPAAEGECIVVRVRVDYGTQYEHDNATELIHFAANGIAYDGEATVSANFFDDRANFEDLNNTPGGGLNSNPCEIDGFENDVLEYEITPRPEVENATNVGTVDTEDKTGDENN